MDVLESNSQKNQITPHQVGLLLLAKVYVHICEGKNEQFLRITWQDDGTSKRLFHRSLLFWINQSDCNLKEMLRIVAQCSKVLHISFINALEEICRDDNEAMVDIENLFSDVENIIFNFSEACSLVKKHGVLGLFFRKMYLYYESLNFSQLKPLYEDTIKYCSQYLPAKKRAARKPLLNIMSDENAENNVVVEEMELESQSEMDSKSSRESIGADLKSSDLKPEKCEDLDTNEHVTEQQANTFLHRQADLVESNETHAMPPHQLQNKLTQLLTNNPDLTDAHFVSYLNNLRVKEFNGSMDSLLTYFIRHNNTKLTEEQSDRKEEKYNSLRYASLNLGLLHMRFNHKKPALRAIKEAIRFSQHSHDPVCLQHAMSVLSFLEPKYNEKKITKEILLPSKKMNLIDIAYNAVQAHMGDRASKGEVPARIFRNLAAADALQASRTAASFSPQSSSAHRASLWKLYGKRSMAFLYCQLALNAKSNPQNQPSSCENDIICLSHLMELFHEEGNEDVVKELMSFTKTHFPPHIKHSHIWRKTESRLSHMSNLQSYKFTECTQAEQMLLSLDRDEAMFRKAENYAMCDEKVRCHSVLMKLLKTRNNNLSLQLQCKIHLLLSDVLGQNKSERSSSVVYVLKAYSLACKGYLHDLMIISCLKLAQIQYFSNSPNEAMSTLKSISHQTLSNGSVSMKNQLILTAIRCAWHQQELPLETLNEWISILSIVKDNSSSNLMQHRLTVYLLARLYDQKSRFYSSKLSQNYIQRRNENAAEFKRLDVRLDSCQTWL